VQNLYLGKVFAAGYAVSQFIATQHGPEFVREKVIDGMLAEMQRAGESIAGAEAKTMDSAALLEAIVETLDRDIRIDRCCPKTLSECAAARNRNPIARRRVVRSRKKGVLKTSLLS
jgi:hypothetical protein